MEFSPVGPDERKALRFSDERTRRATITRDDNTAVAGSRVVHEEAAARAVVGRKRKSQQPPFSAARNQARDVEERRRLHDAIANHPDDPPLFRNVLNGRIRGILFERDR